MENNNLSIKIMQSSVGFQLEALFPPLKEDRPVPYFKGESLSLESVRSDLRRRKLQSMTLNKWIVMLQKVCIKIGFST